MTIADDAQRVAPTASPTRLSKFCAANIERRLVAVFKRMQYARMRELLSKLSDKQLAEIGMRRQDIPARANYVIYGPGESSVR